MVIFYHVRDVWMNCPLRGFVQLHIENDTFLAVLRPNCHHARPLCTFYCELRCLCTQLSIYLKNAIPARVGNGAKEKNHSGGEPRRDECHGSFVTGDSDQMLEAHRKRNKNANCKRLFHSRAVATQSATPSSHSKKGARHRNFQ